MKNIIISKFENVRSNVPIDIRLLDWLNDDSYKNLVAKIRSLNDKEEISKLKLQLPCAAISGRFMVRSAKGLIEHSGYICIDIDGQDNLHLNNFEQVRDELKKIKNIAYASLSVSGKGVFCLIPIKYPEKHKEQFEALKIQFSNIGITIDKACSDVIRMRMYSYDENAFYNEDAVVFNQFLEYKNKQPAVKSITSFETLSSNLDKTHTKVMKVLKKIDDSGIDITEKYEQWFQIGCALANEFGEEGREMFDLVSQNHPKYHPDVVDSKFSDCLNGSYSYTIGTFFHWAEEYGLI